MPDGLRPLVVSAGTKSPLPPSAEGGEPFAERMVEDIPPRRGNVLPGKGAYPQSAYRKGGVFNLRLNTPVAKATSLFRKRNSEPLTAPSAEGAFWRTSCKASPERGGAREAGGGVRPPHKGHSGSVSRRDHSQYAGNRAQLTGGTTYAKAYPPNARRSSGERGLGGEALLSEKRPLPPESPLP